MFNIRIKKTYLRKNYSILFYLLGTIGVFLSCQLLKSTSLIKSNKKEYNKCLMIVNSCIYKNSVIKVCEYLNNIDSIENIAYNLLITLLFIYFLIREIIKEYKITYKYWIVSHLSAIIFSLLGELDIMKFSIDTNTNYSISRIIILVIIFVICITFMMKNVYYNKIKLSLIILFIIIYSTIYLLFAIVTNNIVYHMHHSLITSFMSLFFVDWSNTIDLYIHAILIGIVIQGFNFFKTQEIFMFYISDSYLPNFNYLLLLYSVYIVFCFFALLIRKYICMEKKKNTDIQIPLLIPSERDLEEYKHV